MNILLYALKWRSELLVRTYQKILQDAKKYLEREGAIAEVPEGAH